MLRQTAFIGLLFLILSCSLSCSEDNPAAQDAFEAEAGPWQTVEINGALYRRVAAKPTATGEGDLLITIPISWEATEDGAIRLSDTVEIAGRTYRANCAPTGITSDDDVGDDRDSATNLTVNYAASAAEDPGVWNSSEYELTTGDVDYFRLRVTRAVLLAVISYGDTDTYGTLMTAQGEILATNDEGPANDPGNYNFFVAAEVTPGTYYLAVREGSTKKTGSYTLTVGTWHPSSGKIVASEYQQQLKQ